MYRYGRDIIQAEIKFDAWLGSKLPVQNINIRKFKLGIVLQRIIIIKILYSRKIWRGIKFGSLAVNITTAKLKSAKFPTRIYMYGDPVPNHQI